MKHQQVNVDYWTMGKTMMVYAFLAVLVWLMLRLFQVAFMLPRRLRAQQYNVQNALKQLQERYPDLNITQEEIDNLETDVEKMLNEDDDENKTEAEKSKTAVIEENKKEL
ncbi:uncharacterized protein LOC121727286 [Aricia agestis]|uniref:uncharacterized protein LOC121727286 n=1 Tax=Aricia agestis TaxID=91739 RepID=UPI001C2089E4|nr:uncharacterized protein LOC121727286 [Aricia agestis]